MAETPAHLSPARLLIVDDTKVNRMLLARNVELLGYHASVAENGRIAMEMLHEEVFDLLLLDIEMPEMDGIQFAESVSRDPAWKDTPIIALSSHTAPHIIERSKQAGFVDFVGKFDREGLMESIKDCSAQLGEAA